MLQFIKNAKIELNPEEVLKSSWKKEVKSKLETMNKTEITSRCKEMRKGRTVVQNEYGRKKYMEMEIGEAREIMKMRLHMMALPCNYGKSNEGCCVCSQTGKIESEHYLTCDGTKYFRNKWAIRNDAKMNTVDTDEMRVLAKYIRQVCTLLGTGRVTEESE